MNGMMRLQNKRISFILVDISVFMLSFSATFVFMPYIGLEHLRDFDASLTLFVLSWLIISLVSKKWNKTRNGNLKQISLQILIPNLIIWMVSALESFFLGSPEYIHFIVFSVILANTILEMLLASFYFSLKNTKTLHEGLVAGKNNSPAMPSYIPVNEKKPIATEEKHPPAKEKPPAPPRRKIDQSLMDEIGKELYHFIDSQINLSDGHHMILSTTTLFNIKKLPALHYKGLVNLKRINDIRYINKFFEAVNVKIPRNGIFIGCAETQEQRKQRLLQKFPPGINGVYYFLDFIIKRILPKINLTKKLYFLLTRGQNRVLSRAEILGRLYCCGYEVIKEQFLNGYFYFVARKEKQPTYDLHPTYGPFIKLGRTGKNGKIIKVYKIRTMHPYSEYLQEYVYTHHYLKEGGKFNNDFRISTLGKLFRKYWIDEFLMILNILKGELKLVGVRPLSIHYFNLYTEQLQRERIKYKPGLIPPFYADLPKTLEEIMESELRYLKQYELHPLRTDMRYFFRALHNILFRNSRSN